MGKGFKLLFTLLLIPSMLLGTVSNAYAVEYVDGDTITDTAETLSDEQAEVTQEFLDSLEVTDNFVVYADTLNENCHLDGNIAVNELTTDPAVDWSKCYWDQEAGEMHYEYSTEPNTQVETLKNSGQNNETVYDKDGDELGDYSIIKDGNDLTYGTVDGGATIVGDNISAQNLNGGSKVVEATTDEEIVAAVNNDKIEEEIKIDENLEKIAAAGQEVIDQVANTTGTVSPSGMVNYTNYRLLDTFDKDTVITFTVYPSDLQSQSFANALDRLLVANKSVGSTIILNVVSQGAKELTVAHPINGNAAYDISTDYVVWNFGSFNGEITYKFTTEGEIIAPNGLVDVQVMDGKIVADEVHQNSGQEIHMPYTTSTPSATSTPKSTPTSTVSPTSTTSANPSPKSPIPPKKSTPTPVRTPNRTPSPTKTPSPTITPSVTPTGVPSPTETVSPITTPEPTQTPIITEPGEDEEVEIPSEQPPAPEYQEEAVIPEVLGAARGTNGSVLGARRGLDRAVLGKRRSPNTGDSDNNILLAMALGISVFSSAFLGCELKKKENDEDEN